MVAILAIVVEPVNHLVPDGGADSAVVNVAEENNAIRSLETRKWFWFLTNRPSVQKQRGMLLRPVVLKNFRRIEGEILFTY